MYVIDFFVLAKSHVIFFADFNSLSVISGNFVLWLNSTSFDAIPQDAQNQLKNLSSHVGACFEKVWQWWSHFLICLWRPTYIPFLPHHSFLTRDHLYEADECFKSNSNLKIGNKIQQGMRWVHGWSPCVLSLESYDVAVYEVLCFSCLYQAMNVSAFMYT